MDLSFGFFEEKGAFLQVKHKGRRRPGSLRRNTRNSPSTSKALLRLDGWMAVFEGFPFFGPPFFLFLRMLVLRLLVVLEVFFFFS